MDHQLTLALLAGSVCGAEPKVVNLLLLPVKGLSSKDHLSGAGIQLEFVAVFPIQLEGDRILVEAIWVNGDNWFGEKNNCPGGRVFGNMALGGRGNKSNSKSKVSGGDATFMIICDKQQELQKNFTKGCVSPFLTDIKDAKRRMGGKSR